MTQKREKQRKTIVKHISKQKKLALPVNRFVNG